MKPINPAFVMARRRAEHNAARFGHPHLHHPAIARRGKPLPFELDAPLIPEREDMPRIPGLNRDTAVLFTSIAALLSMLFI